MTDLQNCFIKLNSSEIAVMLEALENWRRNTKNPSPVGLSVIDGVMEKLGKNLREPLTEPETYKLNPGYTYEATCAVCGQRIVARPFNWTPTCYEHVQQPTDHYAKLDTTKTIHFSKN